MKNSDFFEGLKLLRRYVNNDGYDVRFAPEMILVFLDGTPSTKDEEKLRKLTWIPGRNNKIWKGYIRVTYNEQD